MRERIYEIIEIGPKDDNASRFYDFFMMAAIVCSLIPLIFKETYPVLRIMDIVTAVIFIIDYILRLITADFKLKKGKSSFVRYPFTFMAIIDLLAILPSFLTVLGYALKLLKLFRLDRKSVV